MPHLRMCRANVQSYQLDTFPAAFLSVMLTLTLFACQGRAIPDLLAPPGGLGISPFRNVSDNPLLYFNIAELQSQSV